MGEETPAVVALGTLVGGLARGGGAGDFGGGLARGGGAGDSGGGLARGDGAGDFEGALGCVGGRGLGGGADGMSESGRTSASPSSGIESSTGGPIFLQQILCIFIVT